MGNYSHQHDNGNLLDRASIELDLFNTNLLDKLIIFLSASMGDKGALIAPRELVYPLRHHPFPNFLV
jgi:hypothetical protein